MRRRRESGGHARGVGRRIGRTELLIPIPLARRDGQTLPEERSIEGWFEMDLQIRPVRREALRPAAAAEAIG
jgi:hypothetical protein